MVRRVQVALNQRGFDAGSITGRWTPTLSQAVADFQRTYGLSPTGNLNFTTLQALGVWGGQGVSQAAGTMRWTNEFAGYGSGGYGQQSGSGYGYAALPTSARSMAAAAQVPVACAGASRAPIEANPRRAHRHQPPRLLYPSTPSGGS